MMARRMEAILRRYGQEVVLLDGEGAPRQARAFLQPWPEKGETDTAWTELGTADERLWLYLGREMVEPGDRMDWDGRSFLVRSSRPYYIGETLLYWWASLERAKEAAE